VAFGGISESISEVTDRSIFGNFLFDIGHAFALHDSTWTGGLPNYQFVKQPIIWFLLLIPILSFSVFLFNKDKKRKKEIIFFGFIALLGIFLTKQGDKPWPTVYEWLYNNFPGFNLFREASKLYLLTAIGYAGLLGYGLLILKEHKDKIINKYVFTSIIIVITTIAIWNVKPFITGTIGTMFVPRHIPSDYLLLNDFLLHQPGYFRTFWTPTDSKWGIFTNQKVKISNVNVIGNEWKNYIPSNLSDQDRSINNQITEIFKNKSANKLFDISSIKYVIVPLQDKENDDIYANYGDNRQFYIDELDKVEWLKRIDIGTKDLVIYENDNYYPHLYITNKKETIYNNIDFYAVESKQVNPTQYQIKLINIKEPVYLNFSEKYHPDWKLRIGEFNWFNGLIKKDYFLPDSSNFENEAKLNSFYIDPEYIKNNYPGQYIENSDGSIDIELVVYFKSQSYFYLGLIISSLTLLGCLGYLVVYPWFKKRKFKKYN